MASNFYTRSALIATRLPDPLRLRRLLAPALYALLENVPEIKADHNRDLEVEGIVVNQFQPHASTAKSWQGSHRRRLRRSSDLPVQFDRSAKAEPRPMDPIDPKHKLAQRFSALHAELRR